MTLPTDRSRLVFEKFPQEILDLHTEVRKHPPLLRLLHDQDNKDVYIQLLEIATYCDILVIGDFTHAEILALCTKMTRKLIEMRTSIVITGP
jgi:hypothetical protein